MSKTTTHSKLAKYFISISNETGSLISNLKLQKLLFYAQAWHLAFFEERLVNDEFQAWVHGPVLPDSYMNYREFGWKPIIKEDLNQDYIDNFCSNIVEPEQCDILNDVVDEYFGLTAFQLEKLTHSEDPWILARGDLAPDEPSENTISEESMINYYQQYIVRG